MMTRRTLSRHDPAFPRATWCAVYRPGRWTVLVQSGADPPPCGAVVWVEKRDRTHVAVRITAALRVHGWGWVCDFAPISAQIPLASVTDGGNPSVSY